MLICRQLFTFLLIVMLSLTSLSGLAKAPEQPALPSHTPTPDRPEGEGEGPFERLIIRGATVIDGTGSPPSGPMDIVIEDNRIVDMVNVGYPGLEIDSSKRPQNATREIDAHGAYVMPGLVDLHTHVGGDKLAPADYVYKLWLAHGVTTVRGVPIGPLEWSLAEKARSARNEITAPRIVVYQNPGDGKDWQGKKIQTPKDARKWVRYAHSKGVDGLKLGAYPPAIMEALLDAAKEHQLGSTAHLRQMGVGQMNALDSARLGLGSVTHFYGLFEALYTDNDIQPYPLDMNYMNEQHRFGQVAQQWRLVEPGGDKWNAVLEEFLALDYYINPTLGIYAAARDLMRAKNADWHPPYTLPSLGQFYQASRAAHGSFWFYWRTADEVAWKNFYRIWMQFLNDYKNRGGKVTLGSDSGFIYNLYGFGSIQELEMLQEAGFHPLEVIRAATMHSAMEIAKPSGKPIEYGVLRPGMLADLLVVEENPLENLKVLYGIGAEKLNDSTGRVERVGGVKYTIKDGIVYDAKGLLREVADQVALAKQAAAAAAEAARPKVVLETELGAITLEIYTDKAPLSAESFLAHLDQGLFVQDGKFYRSVKADNDSGQPKMDLIQGGVFDGSLLLPSIAHESTRQTGLSHTDGMVSLGRGDLGSARGGVFFICIGDQSGLDHGGVRSNQGDGQGYAVFGKVTEGMAVVRAIHQQQTGPWPDSVAEGTQYITTPVNIQRAYRLSKGDQP